MMKINNIEVKGIVTKSNLPSADFVINPYVGCQHSCIYCYADFMKRFTNHSEKWGSFVDVKINASDFVIDVKKYDHKTILFGSVTDPYQPIESKYELTRKLLSSFNESLANIEILTKSALVLRDIDILKNLNDVTVGISLSTLDEKISKVLEPCASSPKLRVSTLQKLKKEGIQTYAFISPIFPEITDIEKIINECKDFVDYFMFENLNLRNNNKTAIFDFIEKNRPELKDLYTKIYLDKDTNYWLDIEKKIKKRLPDAKIYFYHGGKNGF